MKRFKLIINYPGSGYDEGDVVTTDGSNVIGCDPETFPKLFKALPWWEDRTIDFMLGVKFIEVTKTTGYYVKGDRLAVTGYEINGLDSVNPVFKGYKIGSRFYSPDDCIPATSAKLLSKSNKDE